MASIQKKDNGWQYRVSYKDTDGKYKTKTTPTSIPPQHAN